MPVETDHRPPAGAVPRGYDRRRLAGGLQLRAGLEDGRTGTWVLDEEAAVDAVRPPHPADRHQIRHEAPGASLASGTSERGVDGTIGTAMPSESGRAPPTARAHRGGRLRR